ncbi:MAG: GNAT family N-acetyltransferase [Turicibacter sp.]
MKLEKLMLRPIELEDADYIFKLFQYPDYRDLFDESNTSLEAWKTRCVTMIQSPKSFDYIIEDEMKHQKIGYVGLYESASTDVMELQVFVLEPACCGRGIGSYIMGKIKEMASETDHEVLTVKTPDKNKRAKTFYNRHLFVEMGSEFIELSQNHVFEAYVKLACKL